MQRGETTCAKWPGALGRVGQEILDFDASPIFFLYSMMLSGDKKKKKNGVLSPQRVRTLRLVPCRLVPRKALKFIFEP